MSTTPGAGLPPHPRPADCTCHGFHTDAVDETFTIALVASILEAERCPAERRALARILSGMSR